MAADPSPSAQTKAVAVILAGGAGRRAQGRDKGLVEWRGTPLVQQVYQRIRPQVSRVLISCNRNRDRYAQFAALVDPDRREDFQGPLAGLEAALPALDSELVLVAPCDMPLLPRDLAARLLHGLQGAPDAQIAYAAAGEDRHYLCALLRRSCLDGLPAFLDGGGRAVRHWYAEVGAVAVEFAGQADAFLNLNHVNGR